MSGRRQVWARRSPFRRKPRRLRPASRERSQQARCDQRVAAVRGARGGGRLPRQPAPHFVVGPAAIDRLSDRRAGVAQRRRLLLLADRPQRLSEPAALERGEVLQSHVVADLLAGGDAPKLLAQPQPRQEAEALAEDLATRPTQGAGLGRGSQALERRLRGPPAGERIESGEHHDRRDAAGLEVNDAVLAADAPEWPERGAESQTRARERVQERLAAATREQHPIERLERELSVHVAEVEEDLRLEQRLRLWHVDPSCEQRAPLGE